MEIDMTKEQKKKYESTDVLREFLYQLKGRKFVLDCGHHCSFGQFLGNGISIYNGKTFKIICMECGY